MNLTQAKAIADMIGPQAEVYDSGGGILLVQAIRKDGKFVSIGDECVCLYNSKEDWYDGEDDAEHIDFLV